VLAGRRSDVASCGSSVDSLGSRLGLTVAKVGLVVSVHSELLLSKLLLGHIESLVGHATIVGARP